MMRVHADRRSPTRVKAVVQRAYGDAGVLEVRDVAVPRLAEDEVLVRVRAASVHADVWHVVRGYPHVLRAMGAGLRRPRNPVPGTDVAGVVTSVGTAVTRFAIGAEVFGETLRGHQWRNGGAFAEYVAVPETGLAHKPPNVTFVEAAAVPTSGLIALRTVRDDAGVRAGQHVLVNGAGGGVGSLALQIAKSYGAVVTGVDRADKLALMRSLGADDVIDYRETDFTVSGKRYDVIVDIPGNHSLEACRRALTVDGTYVLVGHDHYGADGNGVLGQLPRMVKLMALTPFVRHLPSVNFSAPAKQESMSVLAHLLETGALTPAIDRTFGLDEVPDALRHLERGGVRGKVVITV
jgi:NADPH:quinone reductase-like Zn-dependent oxidoreductase